MSDRPHDDAGVGTAIPARLRRAVRLQQAGDLARAEALYREVLAAEPDNPDALHLMGVLCHQKGAGALGVGYIERALMLRPDSSLFHRNLAGILQALRRPDKAAEHYRRVIEIGPESAAGHADLARALAEADRANEALAHYRRALELGPDEPRTHADLADLLAQEGRLEEAERHYRAAIELEPAHAPALSGLGNVLRERGRLEEALAHCRRALELAPEYAIGHSDLGRVLQELRRFDEALAAYRRAVALEPRLARSIMKKITKASAGRLWLHPSALRRVLDQGSGIRDQGSGEGSLEPDS
ncbi:MAG: tetratricopeptide repeat protein [Kiloniellaceae bacterium]